MFTFENFESLGRTQAPTISQDMEPLPQSTAQITVGIRSDGFYVRHGDNALCGTALHRKIARSSIKDVKRLRQALVLCFQEAGLPIRAEAVLISERTMGNEIAYRLKASSGWTHVSPRTLIK